MPDHVHLLAGGETDASDGRRFITRAKQCSGYAFSRAVGRRLWQDYGYEHTLREPDDSIGVVRYIVGNPVRAGLVDSAEKYPYSGSMRYPLRDVLDAVAWPPIPGPVSARRA